MWILLRRHLAMSVTSTSLIFRHGAQKYSHRKVHNFVVTAPYIIHACVQFLRISERYGSHTC